MDKASLERLSSDPRTRKGLIWVASFLLVFTIAGFFVLPPVLRSVLTSKLSEALHRDVSIREVRINPYVMSVTVRGFTMKERGSAETFVSFDELYANLQLASLVRWGVVIKEIRLVKPYVGIRRGDDSRYNFSDLIDEFGGGKKDPASKPLRYSLNNIQIREGSVDFLDGPKKTTHKVRALAVNIPFFSNLPYYVDTYVQPFFEADVNGAPVSLRGRTKPFSDSLETVFEVNLRKFDIPYYLEYVPFRRKFVLRSAILDTKTTVSFTQHKSKPPTVTVAGELSLTDFRLDDGKGEPILAFPALTVGVSPSELVSRTVRLDNVLLDSPDLSLRLGKSGGTNVESILPDNEPPGKNAGAGAAEGGKEEGAPLSLEARAIEIRKGKIRFEDLSREIPFRSTIDPVDLKAERFSNAKGKKTAVALFLRTESKEEVKVSGELALSPLAWDGAVEVAKAQLKKYAPYYGRDLAFDVQEGALDLRTKFRMGVEGKEIDASLSGTETDLWALRLRKRGEEADFLNLPSFSIRDGSLDVKGREIVLGAVSTRKGILRIKRGKDGTVNLATLVASPPAPVPPPAPVAPAAAGKGKAEKPWTFVVKKLAMDGYGVRWEDGVTSAPAVIEAEKIRLAAENLSNRKNSRGKASASLVLNGKGTVAVRGTVGLEPVLANLSVEVGAVEIAPFQPYFTDKVRVMVTGGEVSTKGSLSLSQQVKDGLTVGFKGDATVSRFSSLDKVNAEEFLKWDSLHVSGIDAGYNPLRVAIAEVALADFYSRLIVNADGTLNVQGIFKGDEPAPIDAKAGSGTVPAPANDNTAVRSSGSARTITIEKVTVQGGTINFTDKHIKPSYSANLLEIGGRVSGLTSEEGKTADVDLRGKLDNYAPLEITGKVNPLASDLFVDLKVDFKDMDLSPLTPYSGRYAGYTIQKGKLSLDLKYLIVKRKLDSRNNVFLDQFTFGERVESQEATKLPVSLAVALLKNRKGEISLDLPVSGSIDDPKFSIGGIVIKIIVNILVKAATSPFALLGALFGGGEELSYVEYDYGVHDIGPPMEARMKNLVKALHDRPSLKLEIVGHVDTEKDREGLRKILFERKVKAQKLKDLVRGGASAAATDNVKVDPSEYPKYLTQAYKEEKFPKPRNIIGMAKTLPVPEMEKLMLTNIKVTDDDLRQLAVLRAQGVKDRILASKQVEPERVFLVEPKTLQPEKKEKMKDSRVDFILK